MLFRRCVATLHSVSFFFFSSRRRHTRLVSDWSSDVCSSDLAGTFKCASGWPRKTMAGYTSVMAAVGIVALFFIVLGEIVTRHAKLLNLVGLEIGRASCRERV